MIKVITSFLIVCFGISAFSQQIHTISVNGFTFSPSLIVAKIGDQINFQAGSSHPVIQVSESTYLANGDTPLAGGFSFPTGTGNFTITNSSTIYYVCGIHGSEGMKGRILVEGFPNSNNADKYIGFDIFPNPVNKILYLINPEDQNPTSIRVYNSSGLKVYDAENEKQENLSFVDVKKLNKGMYIISVTYSEKTITRKFVKI